MQEYLKLNPRTFVLQTAESEISAAVYAVISKHGLSYAETLSALAELQRNFANQAVRAEREAAQANTAAGHPSA